MQRRHTDRATYFTESAVTARSHYLPYIEQFKSITGRERILEIGCGEGGNLFPFAQLGCDVTGIDLSSSRIKQAKELFLTHDSHGTFTIGDFFQLPPPDQETEKYDVILLHDVIEHIADKVRFLSYARRFLKSHGVIFIDINRFVETGFVHIYLLFTYFPTCYIHVFFASLTKRKKQSTNSLTSSRAEHPSNCLKTGCASVAIASSTDNYGSSIRTINRSSGYLLANCLHSFRTSDICETSFPHLAFIF